MPIAAFGLAVLLAQSPTPAKPAEPADSNDTVVVVGTRIDEKARDKAEKPYSTTPRTVTGSRIERIPSGRRVFTTVASDTGLAGLLSSTHNHMDANGGMVLNRRTRHVLECKAGSEQVSEVTACALLDVSRSISNGDHPGAAAQLRALGARGLNGTERYYHATYSYRLAEALKDDAGREQALKAMLATGKMPQAEQMPALRTLAAMAIRRGDDPAAIAALEHLVLVPPVDARSHANLALLYSRAGMDDKARFQMAAAVSTMQQAGGTPPREWTDFLGGDKR